MGGRNFGNSFIKISPAGTLLDWFTPFNWSFLNATDEDLGIQNALLIPNTSLIVGGGKEGVMYVVDGNGMGHFRSGDNGQIVQSFQASSAGRMNGSPVYWNSPIYGPAIYLWPAGDPLKVFRLSMAASSHLRAHRAPRLPPVECLAGCCRCPRMPTAMVRACCGPRYLAQGRESRAAAGHSPGVPCEQCDARALEQPAERHKRHAR